MDIHLQQLVPQPLKTHDLSASDIWDSDCRLSPGKRYFVVAPSGSGKTTFQHLLYGLRKDYSGSILYAGQSIADWKAKDWAQKRQSQIAIVFQDLRLFGQLSALENIQINNQLQEAVADAEIQRRAEALGVAAYLGQKCETLSYGQQQRIAIIRALCQPFEWLFMDEPFSHLDADNTRKACTLIGEICQAQGAGFVLASLGERYYLEYDQELQL